MNSLELPATEYDKQWANLYDFIEFNPGTRHRRRLIASVVKTLPTPQRVLDAGCGLGFTVRDLAKLIPAENIQGLDFSTGAIKWAAEKFPSSKWIAADLTQIDAATFGQTFDLIICTEVIEHIADYPQVLRSLSDLLEPGGCLIVTTQGRKVHGTEKAVGHLRHFTMPELVEQITNLGLSITSKRAWGWPGMTALKYLANINSELAMEKLGSGEYGLLARMSNNVAYWLTYFLSLPSSPLGPQLMVVAKKPSV